MLLCGAGFLERQRLLRQFRLALASAAPAWLRNEAIASARVAGREFVAGLEPVAPIVDLIAEVADLLADLVAARPQEHAGAYRRCRCGRRGERFVLRGVHPAGAVLV